jgi:glycosyltransferase involved in cell wall biosynthesis
MMTSTSIMKKTQKRYWALILTRNGEETILSTVHSIMKQTVPPYSIFVVDDGSADKTKTILMNLKKQQSERFHFVSLPNRGYEIRRVVKNINIGIRAQRKSVTKPEYMMISGDDCLYPKAYAEEIMERMCSNHKIVIASGDIDGIPKPDVTPRGSGRFIKTSFLNEIGGDFPPYYGYEGWILQKAVQLGYIVKNYHNVNFIHLRGLGDEHRFKDWGLAMKCLGYHPFEVMYRCIRYPLIDHRVSVGYIRVLWDYFVRSNILRKDSYCHPFEKSLREYVYDKQKRRTINRISKFISD